MRHPKYDRDTDLDELIRQADELLWESEEEDSEDWDEADFDEDEDDDPDDTEPRDEDVLDAYRKLSGMENEQRRKRLGKQKIPDVIPAYNADFRKVAKINARSRADGCGARKSKGCCGCIWGLAAMAALALVVWLIYRIAFV